MRGASVLVTLFLCVGLFALGCRGKQETRKQPATEVTAPMGLTEEQQKEVSPTPEKSTDPTAETEPAWEAEEGLADDEALKEETAEEGSDDDGFVEETEEGSGDDGFVEEPIGEDFDEEPSDEEHPND